MSLLDIELPQLTITPDVSLVDFLDRCEAIGRVWARRAERRREYAGPQYDQLNMYLEAADPGYPMLRMVATQSDKRRLVVDVVTRWSKWPIAYDEYLSVARTSFARLLDDYSSAYGKRIRLGISRRPPMLDTASIDCNRVRYAAEKFGGLARSFAVGEGDARRRLQNSFTAWHVIRPNDLPHPLRGHFQWVFDQVTRKAERYRGEGTLNASISTMKNATAARIIQRLLDIGEAIEELETICNRRAGAG